MVLWGHLSGTRGFPEALSLGVWTGDLANFGVRVFFVISGFLITTLLLNEFDVRGRISLRSFYIRRTFRIFPAFYAYLTVVAIGSWLGVWTLGGGDLTYAVAFLMNFREERSWVVGHLWSLSVEEQFYLLWPFVAFRLGKSRALLIAGVAMVASPLLRLVWFYALPDHRLLIGEAFPTIFDPIAAGCALAAARDRLWAFPSYRRLVSSLAPGLLLSAVVVNAWLPQIVRLHWLVGETYINIVIALFIDHAIRAPRSFLGLVLEHPVLVIVGTLSYSIYLWQQPFLNRNSSALWCAFPLNLLCAGAASVASYQLVEKPMLRIRKRFESRAASSSPAH